MDPRIDEILKLTQETNKMVHKMRRSMLWGRFYQVVWWIAILAISGAAYYYYAAPYVNKLEQLYAQVQADSAQAQSVGTQTSSFFGNWMPHTATTTTTSAQ